MSVWSSDSQKLDLYRAIHQLGPTLRGAILPNRPSHYLKCNPEIATADFSESWDAVAETCSWPLCYEDVDLDPNDLARFLDVKRWAIGIEAIYKLVKMIWDGKFAFKPAYDRASVTAAVEIFSQLVAGSTQITPKRFIERSARRIVVHDKQRAAFEDASDQFKFMRVLSRNQQVDVAEVDTHRFIGPGEQPISGFAYRGVFVFRGRGEFASLGLVLEKTHLDYLVGACGRIGNTISYLSRTRKEASYEHAMSWLEHTIRVAGKSRSDNANRVAKAFHKVRTIYQMELLSSEFTHAVDGEIEEYTTGGLDQLMPLQPALEMLRLDHPIQTMETIHIHKWMPPPDFDATSIPVIVKGWQHNYRPSGLDPGVSQDMKEMYGRIQQERKANLLYAYKRRHGRFPPNFPVTGSTFSNQQLRDWDHRGCMTYHQLGVDVVGQVKDKTVVSQSMAKELNGKTGLTDKSYLLWYMANASTVDTRKVLSQIHAGNLQEDNYVRVAYKPESHKPDSRLFYMAPPLQRTVLGEFEGNLANVARYYPGSLMGKDTADKNRLCARIMDLHAPISGVSPGEEVTNYVITFDLAKFSPKSSPSATEEYHLFWSEVFGNPELASLYKIGCKSVITHTTAGITFKYQNLGVDLEGFRGKLMTMFHADLLSTAARIGREKKFIAGRSDLVVFIDDGAIRVAALGSGAVARANAAAFLSVMKEVYAAAGQENHPSKTVVSRTGGEMLAQFYYRNLKVPQGLKAMMRLMPDYENSTATIAEEIQLL